MKHLFLGYRQSISDYTRFFIKTRRDISYFSTGYFRLIFIIMVKKDSSASFGKIIVITRKLL